MSDILNQPSGVSVEDPIRLLEPTALWNCFADLNQVPRPSKKEQRVIEFAKDYGLRLDLETIVDQVGNVIIRKPASAGREDRLPVVLQSHLDMVCQKNADRDFDFETQGIEMELDGDWVHAKGTTLGADNGIGVSSIMAILAADDIEHPPLEALFTIDEETGMTGAKGLQKGQLHGKILLNLDTEEDNELCIGCAGGVDITGCGSFEPQATPAGMVGLKLAVRGLKGGHSGMDIHLGRANSNKIMNRLLHGAVQGFQARIAQIDGGGLRNAIPRESVAVIAVPAGKFDACRKQLLAAAETIRTEYLTTDPQMQIEVESNEVPPSVIPETVQRQLLATIYMLPSGIHRLSPDMEDLVQTSNNLARVAVENGKFTIGCLTRSAVNSERDDLATAIRAGLEMAGAEVKFASDYPGWQPAPESTIVTLMSDLYQELFNGTAHVAACHGGLECGIIGSNYPEMQMISFGPNIRGAHSPDERVQVSSVQKFWGFLLETLKRIPAA